MKFIHCADVHLDTPLQGLALSTSPQELDRVATGLIEELELRNSRPLDPDLLALFLNGKYVEFRDGDRLRPACIYENLEDWKAVLRNLLERGLRRVLLLVQDDFSGLLPITQSLFPNTDIQLGTVHMQRNAPPQQNRCRRVSTALARYQIFLESGGCQPAVRTALQPLCQNLFHLHR